MLHGVGFEIRFFVLCFAGKKKETNLNYNYNPYYIFWKKTNKKQPKHILFESVLKLSCETCEIQTWLSQAYAKFQPCLLETTLISY